MNPFQAKSPVSIYFVYDFFPPYRIALLNEKGRCFFPTVPFLFWFLVFFFCLPGELLRSQRIIFRSWGSIVACKCCATLAHTRLQIISLLGLGSWAKKKNPPGKFPVIIYGAGKSHMMRILRIHYARACLSHNNQIAGKERKERKGKRQ